MGRCLKDLLWLFAGLFPAFADAAFVAHFAGGGVHAGEGLSYAAGVVFVIHGMVSTDT
jgi:hypothetical protein